MAAAQGTMTLEQLLARMGALEWEEARVMATRLVHAASGVAPATPMAPVGGCMSSRQVGGARTQAGGDAGGPHLRRASTAALLRARAPDPALIGARRRSSG